VNKGNEKKDTIPYIPSPITYSPVPNPTNPQPPTNQAIQCNSCNKIKVNTYVFGFPLNKKTWTRTYWNSSYKRLFAFLI
jgi:hypothetical protein